MVQSLPSIITKIWLVYEIWLLIRDRIHGKGKTEMDRGTRYYNFIAIIGGITVASIVSGNANFYFPASWTGTSFWSGVCVIVLGFGLRIWSVTTLGASFRTTVETHSDQLVVKRGPYRLVRHPSYSGLILMCFGFGLSTHNWLSLAFAVVPGLVALLYRIHIEEAVLVSTLGSDYEAYQSKTKRLIPWIW
jgi:protein-S-isoprenylcysteine O-methyltransferase Ste14